MNAQTPFMPATGRPGLADGRARGRALQSADRSRPPRCRVGCLWPGAALGYRTGRGERLAPRPLSRPGRVGAFRRRSRHAAIASAFAGLYADLPHSLVEISDREIAVTLEGPEATTLLTVGCPVDVAGFDVSTGARTIFDGVQVVLYRDARTVHDGGLAQLAARPRR